MTNPGRPRSAAARGAVKTAGPAAFLDRDGTLTVERGYVTDPDDLELIPGAADALARLNASDALAVLISNQSGVARGYMTEDDLAAVHDRLVTLLAREGARLDGAYYAPHLPGAVVRALGRDTAWRKPSTGMVEAAVRDLGVDLERSVVVGDQVTDLELAHRLGIPGVLVTTGKGGTTSHQGEEAADRVVADVGEAIDWFLAGLSGR